MMRWVLLAVLVVALSAVATIAVQFLPSAGLETGAGTVLPKAPDGPAPKVVVDGGPNFDFGALPQLTTSSHTWVVRNEGRADLKLLKRGTTCKCTVANLGTDGEAIVKPGGQTEIRLEWSTKEVEGKFDQSATFATTDPLNPELVLHVTGNVQAPILVYPPESAIHFATVPNEQGARADKTFYSPDRPGFKILSVKSSRPELIEGTIKPMDPDLLHKLGIKGGHDLEVRIKPGTTLGPFSEELVLATDHPGRPELKVFVSGKLVGPINVAPEEVDLPGVSGPRGGGRTISLFVRAQDRTHFEVEKVPAPLKVAIAPADEQPKAGTTTKIRHYRLSVKVPPGAESGEVSGTIELKTDHPQAGHVSIPVHVVIVGAG